MLLWWLNCISEIQRYGSWMCAVFWYCRSSGQEVHRVFQSSGGLGSFLTLFFLFTSPKVYGFLCTSEVWRMLPCNRAGCWYSKFLFLRWRVLDFYQLRIDLCCALKSNCLARKFIVKMVLLVLCFLKDHQLIACFWCSCLLGFMAHHL